MSSGRLQFSSDIGRKNDEFVHLGRDSARASGTSGSTQIKCILATLQFPVGVSRGDGFDNEAEGLNALAFLKSMSLEHILNLVIKTFYGLGHQSGALLG